MEKQKKILAERMKKANITQNEIQKVLPCDVGILDQDIMVQGQSKLQSEVDHARTIHENDRRIIRKRFLNHGHDLNSEEIIAEHIDHSKSYIV